MTKIATTIFAALALVTVAAASNQIVNAPADAYQVRYAANFGSGDSFVNLTNAGTLGGWEPSGDICANVYVFAEDQQLVACCACPLTPNHLKTLSTRNDLINNTLTPGRPVAVTVALLASKDSGSCNAATVPSANLVGGLRAWGTTIHALPSGGFRTSETPFSQARLSVTELQKLTTYCGYIQAIGSTFGICNSCRNGAQGATRQ